MSLINREAEISFLGSCILRNRVAKRYIGKAKESHFAIPAHRFIWRCIEDLTRNGQACDMVTMPEWLKTHGLFADVGGDDYLLELASYVPSAANAEFYFDICIDKFDMREIEQAAEEILEAIRCGDVPAEAIREKAKRLPKVLDQANEVEITRGSSIVRKVVAKGHTPGAPTGFELLDNLTPNGGLAEGWYGVISARSGGGKSSMFVSLAEHALDRLVPVLWVTLGDLDEEEVMRRMIKGRCGMSSPSKSEDLLLRTERDEALEQAIQEMETADFDIIDLSGVPGKKGIDEIFGRIEDEIAERENDDRDPYGLILLDYYQLAAAIGVRDRFESAQIVAEKIRVWCMQRRIPMWVGSQVTDTAYGPKTKMCSDLEDHCAWRFHLEPGTEQSDEGVLTVIKNRQGPQQCTFGTHYERRFKRITSVYELSPERIEALKRGKK